MSFARIVFYERAENLLSFAHFNCAVFNYFYRLSGHLTGNLYMIVIRNIRMSILLCIIYLWILLSKP